LLKIAGAIVAVIVLVVVAFVLVGGGGGDGGGALPNEGGYLPLSRIQSGPSGAPNKKQWSKDCDGDCSIVADSSGVYMLSSYDSDVTLYAYRKSDGQQRWRASVDGSGASILMAGNVLLVETSDGDTSQTTAYSASDGKQLWHNDLEPTIFGVGSTLLFHESGSDGDMGSVAAVDLRSGDQKWKKDGYPTGICNSHVVALKGDSQASEVVEYRLSSGQEEASISIDEDNLSDVACSDDGVFVLQNEKVSAYAFGRTERRWSTRVSSASGLSAGIGLVMVSRPDRVRALTAAKGEEKWSVGGLSTSSSDDHPSTSAQPVSSSLLEVDGDGHEKVVKASNGDEVGSRSSQSDDASALGTKGNYIVRGNTLSLYTYQELQEKWSTDLSDVDSDKGVDELAVGGGQLYVLTDGEIQAYR
jgi:outer membrane protein assembly factor BamB